jgi:mono/diheme cytochrome c family protein
MTVAEGSLVAGRELGTLPLRRIMSTRSIPGRALVAALALQACTVSGPDTPDDGAVQYPEQTDHQDHQDGGAGSAVTTPPANTGGGASGDYQVLQQPSRGSAVALSPDDSTALVVHRDVGSVSVLAIGQDPEPNAQVRSEVSLGKSSEPWQAVIGPDGDTGFVILRKNQKLVRISQLKSKPQLNGGVAVGSEPTSLALSPTGQKAFIANWADGTISVVDTAQLKLLRTIDLNQALVATGYLGQLAARPALAHPRSLVVSNDKDQSDDDETLFVTEYFAQQVEPEAADGSNADTRKVGLVYRVSLGDYSVQTSKLSALADVGFKDQNGNAAGCYPNQLQAIDLSGNYAFIASVCASPEGPLGVKVTTTACSAVSDCDALKLQEPVCAIPAAGAAAVCVDVASVKTTTASVVSVLDTRSGKEVDGAAENLNARFAALFAELKLAAGAQRFPLFISDIAFVPGTAVGYVTANGSDTVFRVRYSAETGKLLEVGASTSPIIDLAPAAIDPAKAGKNPIGISILAAEKKLAVVANDVSRNLTMLDFNTQAIAGGAAAPAVVQTAALPEKDSLADKVLKGKRFFNTGLGRWSLRGQGWGACQSCHSDGLTDNVTWYFARGPRQSVSLDGSFASTHPDDQRILNWTGIVDEIADFENNTRGVSGGVGAIVSAVSTPPATADRIDIAALGHNGLDGSATQAADPNNPLGLDPSPKLPDWSQIELYMQGLRSPRAPSNLDPDQVTAGAELFEKYGACQGCHGGEKWTISRRFYTPGIDTNKALASTPFAIPDGFPATLLPAQQPENQLLRFDGGNKAAFDQILCAMRPVDTFNVAEPGVGIAELRVDMKTVAQGDGNPAGEGRGFNPPSLLNLGAGAPYLHPGNARTLEALFGETFEGHHTSLAPNFLTETDPALRQKYVDQLVQYLLSIDEETPYLDIPAPGAQGGSLCPEYL